MNKKLRISFIIPFTNMTGGIAVVLEYYRQLTSMGHEVEIYYPLAPCRKSRLNLPRWKRLPSLIKNFLRNTIKFKRSISLFLEDIPVKPVVKISDAFIKDADVVVATAWPTAYDVAKLSPGKGRKFYFVQDYEIWLGCEDEVDNSYRLPLGIITIGPWLTGLMKEKFYRADVTEVHNGIRLDKFYPPAAKTFDRASALILAGRLEFKGTRDAIDALTIVKKSHPQLEVAVFGMGSRPEAPFDFEYHQDPSYEKLLSLYQNAAIFIFPSHGEGWGLTPVEAMACGCALVATDAGCIPVINNGQNMVIAEAKNAASIAGAVIKLLGDKAFAEKTAMHGLETVRGGMGWERSAQAFVQAVTKQTGASEQSS
jgi:glycosyltransferase involved in cell wall biosynthesis